MKYTLKLKETLSDIVYHLTYIDNLLEIMKSNKLDLTALLGTPADAQFDKELYYFSFSSVKFGGYGQKFPEDNVVNIVFDGRLLSQRYKGKPVDYWGHEYRQRMLNVGHPEGFHKNDEEEQRLLSNESEIPNAYKYIKEIHINLSKDSKLDFRNADQKDEFLDKLFTHPKWINNNLRTIISFAEREDIPVYLYMNYPAFKVLDKRKAYNNVLQKGDNTYDFLQALIRLYHNKPLTKSNKDELKRSSLLEFVQEIYRRMDYNPELFNLEYVEKLFKDEKEVRTSVVYGVNDFLKKLEYEIHNLRKDAVGKKLVSELMKIFAVNKKNKLWQIYEMYYKQLSKFYSKEQLLQLPDEVIYKDTKWN